MNSGKDERVVNDGGDGPGGGGVMREYLILMNW